MPPLAKSISSFLRLRFSHAQTSIKWQHSAATVKTALYDFHVEQGGKMVDFGGYLLPVLYKSDSITQSHLHTREHCSIFDVSHMLQSKVYGAYRFELIERLTTANVKELPVNKSVLSVFTHPTTGAILDDLIITNTSEDYLYIVSNAGRRHHDGPLLLETQKLMEAEKKDVGVALLETSAQSLLAVQGPQAVHALQHLCRAPLSQLPFMSTVLTTVGGIPDCRVNRCGYTGEDGFEISLPSNQAVGLAEALLKSSAVSVKLAGLGARDSLRLEAGLCLYGSDIDETTTPVEASLTWLISSKRLEKKDFPGSQVICDQVKQGVARKRVGLKLESGPPARHGNTVLDLSGESIGVVTSGGPSPSLGYSIAMAYVQSALSKRGTKLQINVRGKKIDATVVPMPFLPAKYFKP